MRRVDRRRVAALAGQGRPDDRQGGVGFARLDFGDQPTGAGERAGTGCREDQVDGIASAARPSDLVNHRLLHDDLG
jgi:hypothetical protein